MTKHELLVPAGNMECLYQAVANGADAVYLGCKSFGARKFAQNFDNDEIVEAIKYAHLYGVKIYVTMNTLIKDNEVEQYLKQVEFLHRNGVDAIIIQDFGMLCLVREKYPNLEVHASTQANTSSKATAELFHRLGVKRVVFSREMTLDEINSIDVPIEKEVFIHGALCISYSGCCLMSSMLGTRSGNRGECAGSCRLPYSLQRKNEIIYENKYLLSTKELNSAPNIKELVNSDITSFKIEGRMKSPEYVGFITKYYRNLIDNPNNTNILAETNKLKTIFNRKFTSGNLFSVNPLKLMNHNTPNHIGLEIGKVIKITPKKIKIKLTKELNQYDAIRFLNSKKGFIVNFLYDEKGNLINNSTDICWVDNKINLKENDIVCKTQDYKLLSELKKIPIKKISITIDIDAHINEQLKLTISDEKNIVTVYGNKVESSINSPISKERIITQLDKLGETPFFPKKINVNSDEQIFISIKELNTLRREAIDKLIKLRTENNKNIIIKEPSFFPLPRKEEKNFTASVFNEEQLNTCIELNFTRVYVEDLSLYEKYKDKSNVYYKIPRCTRTPKELQQEKNLVSDYYNYKQIPSKNVGDYALNIYNIYTIYYLQKFNLIALTPSVELNEEEIINLINNYKTKFNNSANLEILVYGNVENMVIKGNILSIAEKDYSYKIIDSKKRIFPIFYDGTNTHILNYEPKNITNIEIISKESLRFNFFQETPDEIKKIVKTYQL